MGLEYLRIASNVGYVSVQLPNMTGAFQVVTAASMMTGVFSVVVHCSLV
jgi:hypothetical protein